MKVNKFMFKLKPLLNKYVITVLVIFIFVVFIDENSVMRRIKLEHEINGLRREISQYSEQRDQSTAKLNALQAGNEELERIAREDYYMKKPDEEIFIIKDKK